MNVDGCLAAETAARLVRLVEEHRDVFYLYWQTSSTPWHLAIAIGAFLALFLGRQVRATRRIERARAAIPLVIGGWGTRGKSGVERKKSALFAALGCDVVTKTTGCEAMFIHAQPGIKPLELFIYRPYDKATIWEQRDLMEMARDLEAHVFNYECMALNPTYVSIIQDGWMRDDMSTITNAYPDHEDIQGPSGLDMPYVIGRFIPKEATCFTAEDTMLPVLQAMARRRGTDLVPVGWRDAWLIPEDVLARYSYNVHPSNMALVTRMAEHLEIERDFVWKEVADHIIPDLGVLKVFPEARHRGRRLEFSNGHSANERHGFKANWSRLGLDHADPLGEPDRWLVTVVNNRADRIARSKVFADVLTADASAHAHFLIGTNLAGLHGYMMASLEGRLLGLSLARAAQRETSSAGRVAACDARFVQEMRDLMVEVLEPGHLWAKLEAMLAGLDVPEAVRREVSEAEALQGAVLRSPLRLVGADPLVPEGAAAGHDRALEEALWALERRVMDAGVAPDVARDVTDWMVRYVRQLNTVMAFRERIREVAAGGAAAALADLDKRFRALVRGLYLLKLKPIHDPHVSGDAIVDLLARSVPPGLRIHIHGCQNIKGPGLDWVYRWVNLDLVRRAADRLDDHQPARRMDALIELATNTDYGLLDAPLALEAVRAARERPANQDMAFQTQANLATEHIEERLRHARAQVELQRERRGAFGQALLSGIDWLSSSLEKLLDAGDSKGRRRAADRIKADLVARRMGHDRAAQELREITKRQKGGWLRKALTKRLRTLREGLGLPERRARAAQGERD